MTGMFCIILRDSMMSIDFYPCILDISIYLFDSIYVVVF